jgi:hypothetical protein
MPGGMHAAVRRKLKRLETQKALGGEMGKKAALEIAVILNASTTNEAYPDKKIVNGRPNQKKSPDLQGSRKNLQSEVKPKVATVLKKKPKHLKRKLEQLSSSAEGDDGQREKTAKELKAQMEAWEQTKKERMKKFEAIVESAAGDFFNKVGQSSIICVFSYEPSDLSIFFNRKDSMNWLPKGYQKKKL